MATPDPFQLPPSEGDLNLRSEHTVEWKDFRMEADGRTLSFVFTHGPPELFRRVELREEPGRVIATVFLGVPPNWTGKDSRGNPILIHPIALYGLARIRLGEPLGSREVIDGARSS